MLLPFPSMPSSAQKVHRAWKAAPKRLFGVSRLFCGT